MTAGVVAILLAAGESTRMGRPKPLLPWAGATLVEWQIGALKAAGAERVIAVVGHAAADVEPLVVAAGAEAVVNGEYASGRASSLRLGARAIDAARTLVILNVDQPRPAWVTSRVVEAFEGASFKIAMPEYEGRRGHPVVVDGSLLAELGDVADETLGLRAVTERHRGQTLLVAVRNKIVIVDLNTPKDYAAALGDFNAGAWNES